MYNNLNRLNHESKLFSLSNWNIVGSIINDEITKKFSPILSLDLTEKCNFNCDFCVDKKVVKNSNNELEWTSLECLLNDVKNQGCRAIELTGGGEPTLYSHFSELILSASDKGYRLGMITNGSTLLRYSNDINSSAFDWIRISLNSGYKKTHSKIHGVNSSIFDNVIKGIESISLNTTTGISFIVNEDNYNEIGACIRLAEKIGVKYCEFKPMIQGNKFIHYEGFVDSIKEQLDAFKSNSVKIVMPKSMNNIIAKVKDEKKRCTICYASYFRTLLTPSGIYLCPYLRGSQYRINCPLNAKEIIEARNKLVELINPSIVCNNYCARYSINEIIESLKIISKAHHNVYKYIGWPVDFGEDVIWL